MRTRNNRSSIIHIELDDTPQEAEGKGITDNPLVEDAIAGCLEAATLEGLLGHKLIEGINTDETTVEVLNKCLNSNTRQGPIGYDVAEMRMNYQRLKWDASVLQRIIFGDTSRNRQTQTKAVSVLNLATTVLAGTTSSKWYFPKRCIKAPAYTTVADLIDMGYKLKTGGVRWTDEEFKVFYEAMRRYEKCKDVIQNYATVYSWISSLLKSSRSTQAVRIFAERMYNAKKKVLVKCFPMVCVALFVLVIRFFVHLFLFRV